MQAFEFQLPTRILFGPDQLESLGRLACQLGAHHALIVSDPGIVQAGYTRRGIQALQREGVDAQLFQDVHPNPTTADVDAGLEAARRCRPDIIIGLGGGSAMDCAKGINFLYTNGGRMHDYWGRGKASLPMLPMIAVPTTAGTGSEVQSFALISDAQTHVKMACGDPKASFHIAVLDPQLTVSQPPQVTALTGIDAIAHAVETYVTTRRSPASQLFSRQAWRLLADNFPRVLDHPEDLAARGAMQLGACYAGVAIENSMLGAAHALANPLTTHFGIPHGQAVGLMLPHVVRFNQAQVGHLYAEMFSMAQESTRSAPFPHNQLDFASLLAELIGRTGVPQTLSQCGLQQDDLPQLAQDASQQWTGQFNPRKTDCRQLLEIYRQAL